MESLISEQEKMKLHFLSFLSHYAAKMWKSDQQFSGTY